MAFELLLPFLMRALVLWSYKGVEENSYYHDKNIVMFVVYSILCLLICFFE